MLKVIAILVLSSKLNVAVETPSGWAEATFPNTAAGAEQLVAFAESSVGDPPNGVRVVVGSLGDDLNQSHIIEFLASAGVKHGLVEPGDVAAAAAKHNLNLESALAVAKADEERFGFLYRRR